MSAGARPPVTREQAARRCSLGYPGFAAGAGQGAAGSKKLTLREKERIEAAQITAGLSSASSPERRSEVSSFLEQHEAEQKARRKVHNDRAALRRKAQVEAAQHRRSG